MPKIGNFSVALLEDKKSPSDGQGRVAHRRGSRFYTTILRVVTQSKHTTFREVSRRLKKLPEFDKIAQELPLVGLGSVPSTLPDFLPKWEENLAAPKSHNSAGESALLRLPGQGSVISNQVGTGGGATISRCGKSSISIAQAQQSRRMLGRTVIAVATAVFELNPGLGIPTMENLAAANGWSVEAGVFQAGRVVESRGV